MTKNKKKIEIVKPITPLNSYAVYYISERKDWLARISDFNLNTNYVKVSHINGSMIDFDEIEYFVNKLLRLETTNEQQSESKTEEESNEMQSSLQQIPKYNESEFLTEAKLEELANELRKLRRKLKQNKQKK